MISLKIHRTYGDIDYPIQVETDEELVEKSQAIVTEIVKESQWLQAGLEEYLGYSGRVIHHEGDIIKLEDDELITAMMKLGMMDSYEHIEHSDGRAGL